jgi:hypothetical protein
MQKGSDQVGLQMPPSQAERLFSEVILYFSDISLLQF